VRIIGNGVLFISWAKNSKIAKRGEIMQNFFWRKNEKMVSIEEIPFRTEEELEKYVFGEQAELLEDIFLFKRQVRASRDIPDLIGVDRDNNVVIIENKNAEVTEDILPQILRYALWAETNPDSIKALWYEVEDKPEDIDPDWDKLEIRIVVIAPKIQLSVARYVKKLNYKVDLIEVKRFAMKKDEFVLLNKLEEDHTTSKKVAKGLEEYDRAFYEKYRNKNSVKLFFSLTAELERIVKKSSWKLEKKYNKHYVGFKHGFPNAFGIHWVGSKSLEVFLKIPQKEFSKMHRVIPYKSEYDERWKQTTVRVDEKFKIQKLIPAFRMSYEYILGK